METQHISRDMRIRREGAIRCGCDTIVRLQ